jgi:hypothetical protein
MILKMKSQLALFPENVINCSKYYAATGCDSQLSVNVPKQPFCFVSEMSH